MKLSYIQGNTSLLTEAQIDYLSKKYGGQADLARQDSIKRAVDVARQYGDLGVAEKLLFGYINGVIDEISLNNVEQVKDLDPYKKKAENPLEALAGILLGKKSRWEHKDGFPEGKSDINDYIESLRVYDPTEEQGEYLKYIVKQLAMNNIRFPEDGGRLHQALKFFHDNKNTQQWKDLELPVDLMGKKSPINNWRKLEEIYRKLNTEEGEAVDFTSKRQKERGLKEGYELAAEVEIPNKHKTLYSIYKVIEPEAAQFLGKGTSWCTTWLNDNVPVLPSEATNYTGEPNPDYGSRNQPRMEPPHTFTYADWHPKAGETGEYKWMQGPKTGQGAGKEGFPYTAQNTYLKYNPIYIVFRKHQVGNPDNKRGDKLDAAGRSGQIFQIGKGQHGLEVKNVNDYEQAKISTSLDYVLGKWAESDPDAPIEWIRGMRKKCRFQSYPERPPVI